MRRSVCAHRAEIDSAASDTLLHRKRSPSTVAMTTGSSILPAIVPDTSTSPPAAGALLHHRCTSPRLTLASNAPLRSPRARSRLAEPLPVATGDTRLTAVRDTDVPVRDPSA